MKPILILIAILFSATPAPIRELPPKPPAATILSPLPARDLLFRPAARKGVLPEVVEI